MYVLKVYVGGRDRGLYVGGSVLTTSACGYACMCNALIIPTTLNPKTQNVNSPPSNHYLFLQDGQRGSLLKSPNPNPLTPPPCCLVGVVCAEGF